MGDSHIEKIAGKQGFINVSTFIAFNNAGKNLLTMIFFSNIPTILGSFSRNSTFFFWSFDSKFITKLSAFNLGSLNQGVSIMSLTLGLELYCFCNNFERRKLSSFSNFNLDDK